MILIELETFVDRPTWAVYMTAGQRRHRLSGADNLPPPDQIEYWRTLATDLRLKVRLGRYVESILDDYANRATALFPAYRRELAARTAAIQANRKVVAREVRRRLGQVGGRVRVSIRPVTQAEVEKTPPVSVVGGRPATPVEPPDAYLTDPASDVVPLGGGASSIFRRKEAAPDPDSVLVWDAGPATTPVVVTPTGDLSGILNLGTADEPTQEFTEVPLPDVRD